MLKKLLNYKVSDINSPVIRIIRDASGTLFTSDASNILEVNNPVDLSLIKFYVESQELRSDDYMFASGLKRNPLTYEQAYKIIRELGMMIEIDLSPNSLRKYFITNEIKKGTSENQINHIVGYTDNSVMLKKIKEGTF